ncbi:putative HNH restriction endonuclease [Rhodoblastus sphagnicola]|uniref:hypothetical protein n=1 Tax=Rhodoblastus sphagnicola TaxID=333368 RepID=UPI0011B0011F|nr:hypothetical protein [Rhodoblastus sphagnicola]MBB4197344.1 putative HNH restriction endonuclease [Rhodoblastus sphagnicola]
MSGTARRNPPWNREELILALDLYIRFAGNPPGKSSAEIVELSMLLNRLTSADRQYNSEFRNPNGVYMKLMNFRRFDKTFQAQGKTGLTRGNKLEEVVWDEFAHNPKLLQETTQGIKQKLLFF